MSRKTFGAWTGEQKCHVHIFHIYILQFLIEPLSLRGSLPLCLGFHRIQSLNIS